MLVGSCWGTQDVPQAGRVVLRDHKGHIRLGWVKKRDLRASLVELCHQGHCSPGERSLWGDTWQMLRTASPTQWAASKQVPGRGIIRGPTMGLSRGCPCG